ncbi:MAG TPA: hypothetical protein V6D27_16535 [Vampirovibrionales bacterium]
MQSVSINDFDEGGSELIRYTIADSFNKMRVENTSKLNQGDEVNASAANPSWETQSTSVIEIDRLPSRILMLNVTRQHASVSPSVLILSPELYPLGCCTWWAGLLDTSMDLSRP